MLLVNHVLARGTPAIFVIFVVSRVSSSKALVLLVRMQIRHFRHFRQEPPFSGGTKARFTKSTVFGTPNLPKLLLQWYAFLPPKILGSSRVWVRSPVAGQSQYLLASACSLVQLTFVSCGCNRFRVFTLRIFIKFFICLRRQLASA